MCMYELQRMYDPGTVHAMENWEREHWKTSQFSEEQEM